MSPNTVSVVDTTTPAVSGNSAAAVATPFVASTAATPSSAAQTAIDSALAQSQQTSTGGAANTTTTAADGSGTSSSSDTLGGVDRARFVQRVAKAFQSVGENGGTLRLRLSPPNLGSLKLEVTVRNGAMSARVEADTPQARDLLMQNLPALRERLASQNVQIDQFDVDLSGQSSGGLSQQSMQGNGDGQGSSQANTRVPASALANTTTTISTPSATAANIIGTDQLNVLI